MTTCSGLRLASQFLQPAVMLHAGELHWGTARGEFPRGGDVDCAGELRESRQPPRFTPIRLVASAFSIRAIGEFIKSRWLYQLPAILFLFWVCSHDYFQYPANPPGNPRQIPPWGDVARASDGLSLRAHLTRTVKWSSFGGCFVTFVPAYLRIWTHGPIGYATLPYQGQPGCQKIR